MLNFSSDAFDVLVVDDTELNRQLLSAMLKKIGYTTRTAVDGHSALQAFAEKRPDMVLMDVQMPGMDGFEVVRQMRKLCTQWMPILFISANTSNEHVVEGLDSGGDDYLFKPIHYDVFKAKVSGFKERIQMLFELQQYSLRNKEESEAAHEFMKHFTQLNRIQDPMVQFYMKSAEVFSGDLIAFARTPDNRLNLLLADSAGHGLTSALSVIPLTQPFYAMTRKGFELSSIAHSINKHVREYLPLPRYVAAILVSIDSEHNTLQVWNGGCPPAVLVSEDGQQIIHQFVSKHLPLGVLSPERFDATAEVRNLNDQSYNLMMCSDGTLEALVDYAREMDPCDFLYKASAQNAATLFEGLSAVLNEALQEVAPQDDVALLLARCSGNKQIMSHNLRAIPLYGENDLHLDESILSSKVLWEFSVTLTAPQLKNLDAVPFLLGVSQQIEGGKTDSKVFMVLSELFNNALDHGLLKLDSSLKNGNEGMEAYYEMRAERLNQLEAGEISIGIIKKQVGTENYLNISFKDSGLGFDYSQFNFEEATNNRQHHGRGILLMASMCNSLEYTGNGASVTARLAV
jgi:DNA-binding response OmpR family regulator